MLDTASATHSASIAVTGSPGALRDQVTGRPASATRRQTVVAAMARAVSPATRHHAEGSPPPRAPELLAPLVAHALAVGAESHACAVIAALRGAGGHASFADLVELVGSRVAARFGVLRAVGTGAAVILTGGHLADTSVVEAVA